VAQEYLGSKPVLDVLGMWWHTNFSDKPDSEAAQFFHFDMDRPKWLKFFIYLTDVEATNGPHIFVAGSHRSEGIPSSMLKKGYARLTDEEVEKYYDKKNIIEFTAPKGTIIAEDTRGLHKGKHVEKGARLMLQIQFSNTLFGTTYTKVNFGSNLCTELKLKKKQYPDMYAAYK
jgi:ectoine hydroxylase-related dioxygenase (phytanoyl-CoA dioxygenase family)